MAFALDNIGSKHNAFNAIQIQLLSPCNSTIILSVRVSMENEWGKMVQLLPGQLDVAV